MLSVLSVAPCAVLSVVENANFNENCIEPVVDRGRRDPPGGRRVEVLVRKTKPGVIEQVERVPPELDVALTGDGKALRERRIEVHVARPVENASATIAIGIRRRRREVSGVVREIHRRTIELARADAIRPAGRAVVDAVLHEHGERTAGGHGRDAGNLPAARDRAEHAPVGQPVPPRPERQLVHPADDRAVPDVES